MQAVLGEKAAWGIPEQLLAAQVDAQRVANWQFACAHTTKGNAPKRPKQIPRPGVKDPDRRFGSKPRTVAEMRRLLDKQKG